MSQLEILEYIETPGQFQWGFIKCSYCSMVLHFAVKGKKDNSGYFITAPSSKANEAYIEAFIIDSRSEQAKIIDQLKTFVDKFYGLEPVIAPKYSGAPAPARAQPTPQAQRNVASNSPGGFQAALGQDEMPF
jgi:hypothetical protein